jgi:biopolymer transport protein ExbD
MSKKTLLIIPAVVLFLILAFVVSKPPISTKNDEEASATNTPVPTEASSKTRLKGFQFSPKNNFSLAEFYEVNKELGGNAVAWTGAISELSKTNGGPQVVLKQAKKYRYQSIIIVQSFDRKDGKLFPGFVSGKFILVDFAKSNDIPYLGLGVEVTDMYQKSPAEYQKFVKLFAEFSQAIHQVSPKTKVFTIFQYEQLLGLNGGLFGGKNDTSTHLKRLVADFPDANLVGITTYPTLVYKSPSEMPANYYAQLFSLTTKPVLVTEMGWLRTGAITGWTSSSSEQKEFLNVFATQIAGKQVEGFLWSFLYDPQTSLPFSEIGMRGKEGGVSNEVERSWKNL